MAEQEPQSLISFLVSMAEAWTSQAGLYTGVLRQGACLDRANTCRKWAEKCKGKVLVPCRSGQNQDGEFWVDCDGGHFPMYTTGKTLQEALERFSALADQYTQEAPENQGGQRS